MVGTVLREFAVKVLPRSFSQKENKEIYWNLFWLANAFMQFFVFILLFFFYNFASGKAVHNVDIAFAIAGLVNLIAITLFYRSQGITDWSVRLIYIATFISVVASLEAISGTFSYAILWLLVTHILGAYILVVFETIMWTIGIMVAFIFLTQFKPDWVASEVFHSMILENFSNFIMVLVAVTAQIVTYRMINEQNEKELLESKKKISQQLEENQTLLRIMVHDLNNPLTIAQNYINLERKNSTELKYIDKSVNALEKIRSIVKDVQTLQKIRDGKADSEFQVFNLKDSLNEIMFLFEDRLNQKKINLNLKTEDHFAHGNSSLFANQVIANLLSNAIKFTPEGGMITISIFSQHGFSVFQVSDTGIGISPELKENLFEIKFNTHRPGTAGEGGTGYGLPITKKIIEKLGGALLVKSSTEAGQSGTTFEVHLPEVDLQSSKSNQAS